MCGDPPPNKRFTQKLKLHALPVTCPSAGTGSALLRERSSCVKSHGEERKRTREESRIEKKRKDESRRHEERDDEREMRKQARRATMRQRRREVRK